MSKNPLFVPCIALSAVSVAALGAFAVTAVKLNDTEKELYDAVNAVKIFPDEAITAEMTVSTEEAAVTEAVTEAAAESVSETDARTAAFPEPNTVYIYDNGIEQKEYPIIEDARINDYDMSLLKTDDKKHKFLYGADGSLRSRFGIDVSSYQCDIDWQKVAADGVEFAYIRMGYRGYESGKIVEDKYFRRNIEGARAAGIDTGVYFYSQAISPEEAIEEAEYVINLMAEINYTPDLAVVFDWEFPTDEDPARTDDVTGAIQTACAEQFCGRIKDAGFVPMYYATINHALFRYDMGVLKDYALWMAEYKADTQFTYDYAVWQYSCSGVVDGVEGLCDLNIMITG